MDTRLIHSYLYNLGIQGASALIKPQTFSLIVQKKNLNQRFYHTNYKLKTNIMWACFVILIIDHIGDIIMLHCMHMSFPFRCYLYPSLFIQAHCDVTLCHHSVWHMYLLPARGRRYMYTHSTERKAMELCTRIGIAWKVTVQSCIQRELLDDSRVGWNYQCSSQKFTSKWCIIGMKHPLLLKC